MPTEKDIDDAIDFLQSEKLGILKNTDICVKRFIDFFAGEHPYVITSADELRDQIRTAAGAKVYDWYAKANSSVLNRPMYLCLCPVCLGQFLDTGIYKIVRKNHGQAKERCDFCNYRNGYDFIIYSKAEKKDEVADEWQ